MLLANDAANFFVKKIDNIRSQITSMTINASDIALVPSDLMVDEGKTLCSSQCLTESDVRALITKSAKKSQLSLDQRQIKRAPNRNCSKQGTSLFKQTKKLLCFRSDSVDV